MVGLTSVSRDLDGHAWRLRQLFHDVAWLVDVCAIVGCLGVLALRLLFAN